MMESTGNPTKIRVSHSHDEQVLHLTLAHPRGNVLDRQMMNELTESLASLGTRPDIKAIVFSGDGDHFSYGASIPEHHRDLVRSMLESFHALFRTLAKISRPTVAVIQGQCLGGGLELASACQWIFARKDAKLGQPEIRLGVFPPIASLILPSRIGQAAAEDLILTGRSIDAEEAKRLGLVHTVSNDPQQSALEFLEASVLPRSAVALHHTVKASRQRFDRILEEELSRLEELYLNDLMSTHDANEGIEAFLQKRDPRWTNR